MVSTGLVEFSSTNLTVFFTPGSIAVGTVGLLFDSLFKFIQITTYFLLWSNPVNLKISCTVILPPSSMKKLESRKLNWYLSVQIIWAISPQFEMVFFVANQVIRVEGQVGREGLEVRLALDGGRPCEI